MPRAYIEARQMLGLMQRFGMSYTQLEEQPPEFWELIQIESLGGDDGVE